MSNFDLSGSEIQCHGCFEWSRAPSDWIDGPHIWRCGMCHFTHELTFGSVSSRLKSVVPIDRFKVPPTKALAAIAAKTANDIRQGIRAANARCPAGAMVLLRRAIERECKRLGATKGSLHAQIKVLQEKGILSPIQASTAHAIRAFGNYGAHPDDDLLDEVPDEELEAAIRLTVALVEGLARERQ